MKKTKCALGVLLMFGGFLAGCGGSSGPQRYRVSGEVTHQGNPVPIGRIVFEPDAAQGNTGPQGFAPIENGRFDTAAGKGVVGGPHQVRISGFDGVVVSDDAPQGSPLFPDFSTAADLPQGDATLKFEVP